MSFTKEGRPTDRAPPTTPAKIRDAYIDARGQITLVGHIISAALSCKIYHTNNWTDTLFEKLTINGNPNKWIVVLIPIAWLIGKMTKFPIKPPTLKSEITSDPSSKVKEPVGYLVFSLWSSLKFIVAQPDVRPYDNVNKLQQTIVKNCLKVGENLNIS